MGFIKYGTVDLPGPIPVDLSGSCRFLCKFDWMHIRWKKHPNCVKVKNQSKMM